MPDALDIIVRLANRDTRPLVEEYKMRMAAYSRSLRAQLGLDALLENSSSDESDIEMVDENLQEDVSPLEEEMGDPGKLVRSVYRRITKPTDYPIKALSLSLSQW
jgi:hypothetical protein